MQDIMNRNQQQIYQDVHRIVESLREIIEIMNTIHEQKIKDSNRKV